MEIEVVIDDKGFKSLLRRIRKVPRAISKDAKEWMSPFLSFLFRRYRKFSRGGGDWAPISESWAKRKGSSLILIETGQMLKQFHKKNAQDAKVEVGVNDITVSYKPGEGVPVAKRNVGLTIYDLVKIHQKKREIVVSPNQRAVKAIHESVSKSVRRAVEASRAK